ncbi:MAG: glycoside hydrolase family 2 TIM barrel-domain containing protein, partial [Oscillospiraceae bacterium]|nr:glycoside hydrolase family 2 TIM barrel-domain containing protein [Oscillospiraceae bacterium]
PDKLVYQKNFVLPQSYENKTILLHFGAVDQIATVCVNGKELGRHEGGYLPFSVDITDAALPGAENQLTVTVIDTLSSVYPYGKQRKKRGGMWYTPVSGIWQTVWIEPVPRQYIKNVCFTPTTQDVTIAVEYVTAFANIPFTATVTLQDGTLHTFSSEGTALKIDFLSFRQADGLPLPPALWTPKTPYLYTVKVATADDCVTSYFALRSIEIKNIANVPYVCLNGKPIFLNGVLDQGYFCDGIYLPISPKEYEKDILRMKSLGFNMLRKHIKIEPEQFYYYCDKLGMLFMQDMVNSGLYSWLRDTALPNFGFSKKDTGCSKKDTERRLFFEQHMKDTLYQLYNHPCIIAYTLFNEGWGQFESDRIYQVAKQIDPTRLYDSTSGWFAQQKSDFDSRHIYFKSIKLPAANQKPLLVSECGGYAYKVENHVYAKYSHYGYGNCETAQELTDTIVDMYQSMIIPAITSGTCGCVYTQLSDVEDETNGLYTYDRKICKVFPEPLQKINEKIEDIISNRV